MFSSGLLFNLIFLLKIISHNQINGVIADFSPTLRLSAQSDDDQPTVELIHGTQNYRIFGKKGKEERPWFDGRDSRHVHCGRPGRCEKLKNTTCFGSKLSYSFTSLDLTDSFNQDNSRERLYNYEALRHVPKCWAVIQPFLCAVYVPKCERIGQQDMVYLPSLEMCRITLEPCRILYNTSFFPEFLKCNETLFPSKCSNDVREMKFNATGQCLLPLVETDSAHSYYPGIEGCGIQCKDPMYTDDEHRQINKLIAWGATICLLCNLLAIATFCVDWKNANKYPAVIICYINICFSINCFAWLAQFTPGSREDIVCRKDGTLRHSEPSAGENLSCIVVFVTVYYSLIAVMVWFVILTYSWHLRAIGNVRIDKRGSYFHLIAWSLPLVLTITIMALSEVDGNSTAGICFVGYVNHSIRGGFLLGPLAGVLLIGGFFIGHGMVVLFDLKNFASASASGKIHNIIVRMGLSSLFAFVFIIVAILCQIFEFRNSQLWAQSLKEFIICKISSTYSDNGQKTCKMESRPSLAVLQLQLLCLFLSGVVMSSWCWVRQSVDAWKRYIKKKCGKELNDENKIQKPKHAVIAQTYAKRKEFQEKRRLSISFFKGHSDPVGLNFDINDLNSVATNEISSTWCNYLPNITQRRCALTPNSSSCGGPRKSSIDSEISVSVRQFSMESRRNSMDSQVSVKIAEVQTKVACRTTSSGGHHHHMKNKTTARRKHHHRFNRRESSTSVESQIITSNNYSGHKVGIFSRNKQDKRMRRRSANAGLCDADDINTLITNFPDFSRNFQGMTTTSDDDNNQSRTSLKFKDSMLDVVVSSRQLQQQQQQQQQQNHRNHQNYSDDDDDEELFNTHKRRNMTNIQDVVMNHHQALTPFSHNIQHALHSSGGGGGGGISGGGGSNTALALLRSSREGRSSKNSQKSNRSRKSSRHSMKRNHTKTISAAVKKAQTTNSVPSSCGTSVGISNNSNKRKEKSLTTKKMSTQTPNNNNNNQSEPVSADDSSFMSYSSGLEVPTGGSFSGVSIGKHSKSSKTSCDVGTQANAHEIAILTKNDKKSIKTSRLTKRRCSDDDDDDDDEDDNDDVDNVNDNGNNKNDNNSDSESICTENDKLLSIIGGNAQPPTLSSSVLVSTNRSPFFGGVNRRDSLATTKSIRRDTLSHQEALKLLLLPTK